jgi:DNA-binding CsgD family transcriptional regulator
VEQLVGREAELQAIRDALERPTPAAIVLEGEAGIGKTALWQAGLAAAEERGMRPLVARPAEAETGLSHASLGDILGPVVDELPADFPAVQRHALDVALLRAAAEPGVLDPRAVGAATLGALRAAAASARLVVAIDDIQWLDAASGAAIRFALRRLGEKDRVLLLATRRAAPETEPVDIGLDEERITRVVVGALDAGAVELMLTSRLDAAVPKPALSRLTDISGGNPYFALELGRAALRQAGGPGAGAELPLPDQISAVLQDRLRALPGNTTEALGTVAAMGQPTVSSVAEALDPGVLDPAFDAGVLHEEGQAIRFDHPLLAEAAYRALPPSRRRTVHERLAEATTDAEQRARHLAAASTAPDARIAAAIASGAEAAAERGAPVAGAELLEASARLEPEPETAALRRIAAVGHYTIAGDAERADTHGRALVDELPPGPLRSRALTALVDQEGSLTERIGFAEQAVAEAGADSEALITALLWQAVVLVYGGRHAEGSAAIVRASALCTPDVPDALKVMVVTIRAHIAHLSGDTDALELARNAADLGGDDVFPAGWGASTMLGRGLMSADDLEAARPILEEVRRRAIDLGEDESRAALSTFLAELEMRAGRLDAARRYAHGQVAVRAMVAAYEGDVALARELAERGLANCERDGDAIVAASNRTALGFLDLSLGDNAAALGRFEPAVERFLGGEGGDPGLRHNIIVPDAVEALVALGRGEEARRLLAAWEEAGERFDRPRIRATAARCRALLAAAEGDIDTAIGHAEEALEHHRELPVPFERARTLIVLGTLHRRAKHKAAARAALEEAVEILDGMGARLWSERARAELGRIGGRAAADGLTPTEQRVADLVAEGRSNKEVAGELFVSVRTVEANLTRVYAKLGIRSRSELAATRQASDGRSRSPAPPPAQRS